MHSCYKSTHKEPDGVPACMCGKAVHPPSFHTSQVNCAQQKMCTFQLLHVSVNFNDPAVNNEWVDTEKLKSSFCAPTKALQVPTHFQLKTTKISELIVIYSSTFYPWSFPLLYRWQMITTKRVPQLAEKELREWVCVCLFSSWDLWGLSFCTILQAEQKAATAVVTGSVSVSLHWYSRSVRTVWHRASLLTLLRTQQMMFCDIRTWFFKPGPMKSVCHYISFCFLGMSQHAG